MSSMYFQGGDFVELLSAQGKAPGSAWKLQGKISKTFDKGIKGNAFQLDGSSETKMQLPKAASSSLGLAQRFVVLQLLVPFTRSFSVEICFSDFQKVRRRFVVASAFRETARTALHVQLSLSTADVPRDQWINLVFDLQSLSEMHFPDTGYRSMESICVGGSCRLKRIFTLKDAPTPSRGSQVVMHADIRDIPRQFMFSATQRGASGATPLPTQYFGLESASGFSIGIHRVAGTADNSTVKGGTPNSSRRSQTAPVKAQTKSAKGVRTVRPASGLHPRKTLAQPKSATHSEIVNDEPVDAGQQRVRTPVRVSTTGSKLRQPQSKLGTVVMAKKTSALPETNPPSFGVNAADRSRAFEEKQSEMAENNLRRSCSPAKVSRSCEDKKEITRFAVSPTQTEHSSPDPRLNPANSVRSSLLSSSNDKSRLPERQSQSLRQSILGEIQQKLASLEDDDEREDQRNRELFLRHTSLHSGEWHLQQLRDGDLNGDDGALLSDDGDDHIQLSTFWRRESSGGPTENSSVSSPDAKQRCSRDGMPMETLMMSRYNADKESIFSFSSLVESKTSPTPKSSTKLFDFDSLLQNVKPLAPPLDKEQTPASINAEYLYHPCSAAHNESVGIDADNAADDLELTKLLAAKRAARQPTPQAQETSHENGLNQPRLISAKTGGGITTKEADIDELRDETQNLTLSRDRAHAAGEREEWVIVEKDLTDVQYEEATNEDKDWHLATPTAQKDDSDIDIEGEDNALSMDLTSELSASDGENIRELEEFGNFESSVDSTNPGSPDKPESDHDSCTSSQHDDLDNASSFDFEDLVEDAESSNDRDEDETTNADADTSHHRPAKTAAHQLKNIDSTPPENQVIREHRGKTPELRTRLTSVKSPVLQSPPISANRSKLLHRSSKERSSQSSHSVELSSSFSSRRLQRLLESTDWSAELNAQASTIRSSSPLIPRSRDQRQKSARNSSSTPITDVKRPIAKARTSPPRPPSRSQTPSTSSIELVYDPLLRCYYDPIANKYYALAE